MRASRIMATLFRVTGRSMTELQQSGNVITAPAVILNRARLRPPPLPKAMLERDALIQRLSASGNRLTLLRDVNGDGRYEQHGVFAQNLNAPYGLALIDDTLYVANQDALVRFDYSEGQTQASGGDRQTPDASAHPASTFYRPAVARALPEHP